MIIFCRAHKCLNTFADDNGNINDGTPHMTAIFEAFNTQEIACNTPTAKDSGCGGTPQVAPQVTVTAGNMRAVISWAPVAGASNYEVFRTEGVKKCSQGKVKLATTTSTTFTDTGLMNDREYYYIVIPKGPAPPCFGRASACMAVTPIKGPVTPSPTKKPSPPTNRPTPQPTKVCGNGFCNIDEDISTCPVDCDITLDALDNAPKGAPGIMFAIQSKSRDIEISSFEFFTWQNTMNLVQIYTRAGQFNGFESSQTGWVLIYNAYMVLGGDSALTKLSLSSKIKIPAGLSQSFYIWIDDGAYMKYKDGTQANSVVNSDSFISVFDGKGITAKFPGSTADIYSPRSFVGMIR